jgi:hypothetical protein
MLAKQTIRYTLPMTTAEERKEARIFASGIDAFYGWGGAEVRIIEQENTLIVEYDHIIETTETVFGGKAQ